MPPIGWVQAMAMLRDKRGCIVVNNVCQPDHFTLPQPIDIWPTSALMRSAALSMVWPVRWV